MTPRRTAITALALVTLLGANAHAQQWGGSPPATNGSRTTAATRGSTGNSGHDARQGTLQVDPSAYAFVFGATPAGRPTPNLGGSWNGSGVYWGGSPPATGTVTPSGSDRNSARRVSSRPAMAGATSPVIAAADSQAARPPAASRAQQYLMRRGRP